MEVPSIANPAGPARPRICMLNYYAWGVIADLDGKKVHIGGEEVQHALLSRYLARTGYQVTSLVGDFGQGPLEQVDGVQVRKTFKLAAGLPGLRFFTPRLSATWAALKAADADVYYISCAGAMVGVVAAFCRLHGRRFVFRIASDADCAPHTLMVGNARDRWLYHYGLRRADRILAQTAHQAALLLRHYGLHADVAGMFSDLPEQVGDFGARATDLLWLANMRSMKRPEWFLDIVRRVPELRCEMAGGAHPDELPLYRRAEERARGLPNLAFHGQVKFGMTRALFARARIFVNTSSFEGFPNTYLQAWANGVPVVATFDPDGLIAARGLGVAVRDAGRGRRRRARPAGLARGLGRLQRALPRLRQRAPGARDRLASLSGGHGAGMNAQQRGQLMMLWRSDLYRHMGGQGGFKTAVRAYRLVPGFRFMLWLRLAAATAAAGGPWKLVHLFARLMHKHYRFKFGISIPYNTEIGPGFYIGHFGGIVVNERARIGRNCNISHGVTIGQTNRGARAGVPVIGDAVYLGPGAVVIGAVTVGNGSAIGANAVVTRDLCENAIAVGIPARVISTEGSAGYVEFCDYPGAP